MLKNITFSIAVLFISYSQAAYDPQHLLFTKVLSINVKDGVVNYENIKKNASELESYLSQIKEVKKEVYDQWTPSEQMAYLINAYNAFTLKMISDFYPVESIRDIGGKVGGNVFNKKSKQWRVSEYEANGKKFEFKVAGKAVTLDEIEHDMLRPLFKDPRVHFALVCGAVSCPFLRSEAYVSTKLSEQLDAQGKQFLADPFRNRYDDTKKVLYLSRIFDWFKGDFTKSGKLVTFLKPFLPQAVQSKVNDDTDVEYLEYQWDLNSKPGVVK